MVVAERRRRRRLPRHAAIALLLGGGLLWPSDLFAQSTIRNPGARTAYSVELEPHLFLGAFDPPGPGDSTGVGGGVRTTIEVAPRGFIPRLNDSVGIGLGVDFAHYDSEGRGRCARYEPGPNDTRICTDVEAGEDYLLFPVVMQWNFWLTRRWSVFGEPGFFLHATDDDFGIQPVSISGGGRWHFVDSATLTLRLGYPAVTLGVSFLL